MLNIFLQTLLLTHFCLHASVVTELYYRAMQDSSYYTRKFGYIVVTPVRLSVRLSEGFFVTCTPCFSEDILESDRACLADEQ